MGELIFMLAVAALLPVIVGIIFGMKHYKKMNNSHTGNSEIDVDGQENNVPKELSETQRTFDVKKTVTSFLVGIGVTLLCYMIIYLLLMGACSTMSFN